MSPEGLLTRLLPHLTPDLLEPARRRALAPGAHPTTGHCAVATEALYHALGGRGSGYTPMSIQHEGTTHWYLRAPDGRYLDPTAAQFRTAVPYARGRGRGFPTPRQGAMTPPPSRRAATVLTRAGLMSLGAAGLRPIDAITMLSSNALYALSDEEVLAFGAVSDAYVAAEAQRHWSDQDNQTILYRNGRITSYTPPREDDNGRMQKAHELERRPAASAAVGVDIGRKYRFPSMALDRAVTLFNRILIAHLHRASR